MRKLQALLWTVLEKLGRNNAVISNFKVVNA